MKLTNKQVEALADQIKKEFNKSEQDKVDKFYNSKKQEIESKAVEFYNLFKKTFPEKMIKDIYDLNSLNKTSFESYFKSQIIGKNDKVKSYNFDDIVNKIHLSTIDSKSLEDLIKKVKSSL